MNYPIAEIFHSIQTEGPLSGTPATFIRLAGCNLSCDFCDTDHSVKMQMPAPEIAALVQQPTVIITGGEPTLYDLQPLVEELSFADCIQIETNGSQPWQDCMDNCLVVCSPKQALPGTLMKCDAVKILVDCNTDAMELLLCWRSYTGEKYLQPIMGDDDEQSIQHTVQLCLKTGYKLSLQYHKLINIP